MVADPKECRLSQCLKNIVWVSGFGSIRIHAPSPLLMIAVMCRYPTPLAFARSTCKTNEMIVCQAAWCGPTCSHQRKWSWFFFEQASFLFWSDWCSSRKPHLGSTKCCVQRKEAIIASRLCIVQNFAEQWPNPAWTAPCSSQDRWSQKPYCFSELLGGRLGFFPEDVFSALWRKKPLRNFFPISGTCVYNSSIILLMEKILHQQWCLKTMLSPPPKKASGVPSGAGFCPSTGMTLKWWKQIIDSLNNKVWNADLYHTIWLGRNWFFNLGFWTLWLNLLASVQNRYGELLKTTGIYLKPCGPNFLPWHPWPCQKMHHTAWGLVQDFASDNLPTWNAAPKKAQGGVD